ncbi:hypothetical protein D8B26_000929 [Coccidioides posadasii str. Silveira]|uniref:Nucleoside transporter n=3 Tax=Coccidioides posadasii TaxID=199306 RepID=E9CR46_COCPS|nr:Nucleoside transporter family protein [Coccidioides posadasii C735 delta SOWgp]EER28787.1 Nucleoside transporter family protein [Coccidioides posadasii C735 delta SOWgp]EFW22381.1 nucleoside transporter [Coccidioides posadasii str. Silveira]KMM64074.1 hypothetical protein CPAG_00426 [Coccidioides posadasii RMSCC 3488]QVM06218.1 hypothetical protein D8B26_000929 [Coccidioides posadasii str. Silveira]|eukprot:XP_003070932.1 Nucleoside transporter family protein [Coccidioides posadasii C735 delta SOWgp]
MLRSRLQQLFAPRRLYKRVDVEDTERDGVEEDVTQEEPIPSAFSWLEYGIFLWMGVSMLWAWNMFLAAAPYFQRRFASDPWIRTNFQSSILSVSCITNLTSVLVLAKRQKNASYPRRIRASMLLNICVFTLLALSTVLFRGVAVWVYFVFILVMVFAASMATGTNQNGVFAYVASFGRNEYTQGIMVGQGVAGVLPCIVQVIAVLAVPDEPSDTVDEEKVQYQSAKSAFVYFATATIVSSIAFVAFLHLNGKHQSRILKSPGLPPFESDEEETPTKRSIPLLTLFRKVPWAASAMFITFAATMAFPVFTAEIHSVREAESPPPSRIFQAAAFIPLGFLFWNSGDLLGRMSAGLPMLNKLTRRPFLLFVISLARILFVPLYLMCNIRGEGAKVKSDFFYLFVVQLLFGVTNGYLCSSSMVSAVEWVGENEREAAGAFMSLMLVAGLTTGSLLSFFVAKL